MRRETVVSGDIGGTNTRFTLLEVRINDNESLNEKDRFQTTVLLSHKYENANFPSFLDVLKHFLINDAKIDRQPLAACFAAAGPVKDNKMRFTNRAAWSIDGFEIEEAMGIKKVLIINDFLAVGYGILTLDNDKDCITLQHAPKISNAPIACIGAGTGLGECFLTPGTDNVYTCFPSEGGHAEFAPRNELEIGLLTFLKEKFNQQHRVSVERVVSGSGLANIYEYLALTFPEQINADLHEKIEKAGDMKGAVIATNTSNDLCRKTMEIFATAYGSEAGVAGLKWLPYGGLYLTGGLTPKNIDWIKSIDGPFLAAFFDKGRVSGMLNSIPVYAVMVENLGERGAEYTALKLLKDEISAGNFSTKASFAASSKKSVSLEESSVKKASQEQDNCANSSSHVMSIIATIAVSFAAGAAVMLAWKRGRA